MKLHRHATQSRLTISPAILASLALFLFLAAQTCAARAQAVESKPCDAKPAVEAKHVVETYQTIYLTNATQQNDLTDIQTAIRNMISRIKVYGIPSQNAISIQGTPEDIALAQKIVSELDRPKKIYRLTFSMTEIDAGKRGTPQSYSLIVASGEKSILKRGGRVPIFVGTTDARNPSTNPQVEFIGAQVQYQDVGLNIEATVAAFADGVRLRSKVEQSSLSDEKSGVGVQDPVFHQTAVDGTATLALGKPFVLGSLATPDSARTEEIAVVAELVK
jgi:type II secretory pathway component GspD/PulD (secretin)